MIATPALFSADAQGTNLKKSLMTSFGTHGVMVAILYAAMWWAASRTVVSQQYEVTFMAPKEVAVESGSTGAGSAGASKPSMFGSLMKSIGAVSFSNKAHVQSKPQADVDEAANRMAKNAVQAEANSANGKLGLSSQMGLTSVKGGFSWGDVQLAQTADLSELSAADLAKIQKLLSLNFTHFRDCYEKALLIDSKLGGFAQFTIPVVAGGRVHGASVHFDGTGNSESQHRMDGCLADTVEKIPFPAGAAGRKLQFKLRLKS